MGFITTIGSILAVILCMQWLDAREPIPTSPPLTPAEKESAYIRAFKNSCPNTLIQDFTRTDNGDEIITLKCITETETETNPNIKSI